MEVLRVGDIYYCADCLQQFKKKFNAQRHFNDIHKSLPSRVEEEVEPILGGEAIEVDELDNGGIDYDDELETVSENDIDQLLLNTLRVTLRQMANTNSNESDDDLDESDDDIDENGLSIEDDWVFPGSKISIKEHASSVLGNQLIN